MCSSDLIQANAITFLQQAYPWIKRSDIFEQQDHRTPLIREHHELIINQAAHARKIVEELFHDWDDFPLLSDDEEPEIKTSTRDMGKWTTI